MTPRAAGGRLVPQPATYAAELLLSAKQDCGEAG